ncbi:MAG: asparagine synthase (glutamine-hydrolyzing) [Planctomycetota bacterium]
MCGFTGFAWKSPADLPDREQLRRMTDTLEHRGPNDAGYAVRGSMALGFRRLSIIDLAGGHQPLEHPDLPVVIVGNGGIYNFRELRAGLEARGARFSTGSDIETILHLYLEKGERLVEDLVGMFAFAIIDTRDPACPVLTLGRDRLGIKPLYYGLSERGIVFGSELKALLASGEISRDLRPTCLMDYLVQGYMTGELAAFDGSFRLPAGHTLTWTPAGGVRTRRYWDLPTDELRDPATNDEVLEWVDRVVRDRLVAEVPLGAFLSGGIDSNAVVDSIARSETGPPIVCTVGFQEKTHDEVELARLTAQRVGAKQYIETIDPDPKLALETLPWFFDEPLADTSTVPTYLVSQMASRHMTVVLSGDGGDETFAGYRRYVHDLAENRLRRRIGGAGARLAGGLGAVYPKADWAPRFLRAKSFLSNLGKDPALAFWHSVNPSTREQVAQVLNPDLLKSLGGYDPFDRFRDLYHKPKIQCPLFRAQYGDFHSNLPDRILAKVDRASMAVSIEVRVPLLDHRFVGRFANLPAEEKIQGSRGKHRLREALRSRLDARILDGKKRGFDTPIGAWLRGPLKGPAQEALESLPEEWLRRDVLRSRFKEHQSGLRDWSVFLWSVVVLEHWRRRHAVKGLSA